MMGRRGFVNFPIRSKIQLMHSSSLELLSFIEKTC